MIYQEVVDIIYQEEVDIPNLLSSSTSSSINLIQSITGQESTSINDYVKIIYD